MEVTVVGAGEQHIYNVPKFTRKLDVLDVEKTLFVRGTDRIIKPYFSFEKVKNYAIFCKPSQHNLWKITSGLYVSEKLRKAIESEKLSGLEFEKTRVN